MTERQDALTTAVQAVNGLTKRWMLTLDEEHDFIGSGLGAWMTLSGLLIGAHGRAQDELSAAAGIDQAAAPAVGSALASLIAAEGGLHMGTGLWTRPTVSVLQSFIESGGFTTVGEIPTKLVLDAWASEQTNGLIDTFPVTPDEDTLLLLASAVVAELEWEQPFDPFPGAWNGSTSDDNVLWLGTGYRDLDRASIVTKGGHSIGCFRCVGSGSFDVHLVSGDSGLAPGDALGLGIDAATDASLRRPGNQLDVGEGSGGLRVIEVPGSVDELEILLPAFSLSQSHDLMESRELWGLETASDTSQGHFAGLAKEPLAVEAAVQDALVDFNASGFKAAAVTAFAVAAAGVPMIVEERCTQISFNLKEPFGFLAVHRDTGLVLFSGWVATEAALQSFDDELHAPQAG